MKLYLVRHAPAEYRHIFAQTGQPDHLRPLTTKGIQRMSEVLDFFHKSEPQINVVLQSPFTRCLQTGEVFKRYYPQAAYLTSENLTPDHSCQKLYEEIQSYQVDSMALIGHEPDMGMFLSWLLFHQSSDHFPFKKAGIAKVDLYKDGRSYLKWLIRPKFAQASKT